MQCFLDPESCGYLESLSLAHVLLYPLLIAKHYGLREGISTGKQKEEAELPKGRHSRARPRWKGRS